MAISTVHGFPRIGPNRELKFALEAYWRGETSADELQDTARGIRRANWELMRDAGIDLIPSNDFSLYDQMLDTAALVGVVPRGLDAYFAAARGTDDSPALEMTKWFDTNYHYIVPELGPETPFELGSSKPFDEYAEAKALGIETKPVLIGPLTFLLLSKPVEHGFDVLDLLDPLVDVYAEVLRRLDSEWVQLDEPAFVEDRTDRERDLLARAYERLAAARADLARAGDRPRRRAPLLDGIRNREAARGRGAGAGGRAEQRGARAQREGAREPPHLHPDAQPAGARARGSAHRR